MQKIQKATLIALLIGTIKADGANTTSSHMSNSSSAGENSSRNTVYEYMNALDNPNEGMNQFDTQAPFYPEQSEEMNLNTQRMSWETNQERVPMGTTSANDFMGDAEQLMEEAELMDGANQGINQFDTTAPTYPENNYYQLMNQNDQQNWEDFHQDEPLDFGDVNGNWESNAEDEIEYTTHSVDQWQNTRDQPNEGMNEFDVQVPFYPEQNESLNQNTQVNWDTNEENDNSPVKYGNINGNWQDGVAPYSEPINLEGEGIEHYTTPLHGPNTAGHDQEDEEFVPYVTETQDEQNNLNLQNQNLESHDEGKDIPYDDTNKANAKNDSNMGDLSKFLGHDWNSQQDTAPRMNDQNTSNPWGIVTFHDLVNWGENRRTHNP